MEYKNIQYVNVLPGYLDDPNLNTKSFYQTGLSQDLENIVSKNESNKDQGFLERVFSDKTKNSKATVKALLDEISLREKLDSHLLYKIDQGMSRQQIQLENLNDLRIYSFELTKDRDNTKSQLENNVLELEKEKRKEYLECWRDLMFMRKYLFSALKDYWDLSKRRSALSDDLNDITENENNKRY